MSLFFQCTVVWNKFCQNIRQSASVTYFLSQVYDDHIHLHTYIALADISDIRIFLLPNIAVGIGHRNPTLVSSRCYHVDLYFMKRLIKLCVCVRVCACVCVCVSVLMGSETWIFTHGVGSNNFCGDKILHPTTVTLNFRVKTCVYWG